MLTHHPIVSDPIVGGRVLDIVAVDALLSELQGTRLSLSLFLRKDMSQSEVVPQLVGKRNSYRCEILMDLADRLSLLGDSRLPSGSFVAKTKRILEFVRPILLYPFPIITLLGFGGLPE